MNTFTLERNNYRRKLITLVKQHPILWNKTQENYNRNRPQKIMAWHQISEQLDISVDKLRRTWENLRDQYRRDLKREVRFGFKSKWRFFADMDFIRTMVSCKEHEFKENEFTDSDSELDVTDNQQQQHQLQLQQTQCSPISTTVIANTSQTLSTPITSTITSNNISPTNILAFQPIMLSKQWQPVQDTQAQSQIYNNPPQTSNFSSYKTPNTPEHPPEYSTNCDSSKDYSSQQTQNNPSALIYENIAKEEPDLDLDMENNPVTLEIHESSPTKALNETQAAQDFQEPCVSTSCHKRSRISIDDNSDVGPQAAPTRNQIKTETDLNVKDDDYYFVMSLLPSLRQIPRNRKFPLRIGIMSLIAKDLEEVCKE